ncbi:FG-GAP repeat domain-containing protein [Luteitalea sp.]
MTRACAGIVLAGALVAVAAGSAVQGAAGQRPSPTAPEQAWLTDAEGRQYRLESLPRAQGQKTSETRVRTMWGVEADLAREDTESFYIKIYKVTAVAPPPAAAMPAPVTEALPDVVSRLRFTPMGTGLPAAGQWREGLVVTDVTGDGQPEIVAGPARKTLRAPSVFTRTGQAWTRATVVLPPRPYDYGHLAIAPASPGAPAVLAMGVHLRGMIALHLSGPSAFVDASDGLPFVQKATDAVFSSRAVVLSDCNGDGRPDLLALGEGMRPGARGSEAQVAMGLQVFTRAADGAWSARPPEGALRQVFGTRIAAGDVDGDGHVDLVIASGQYADGRVVFRGDGQCGFAEERLPVLWPHSFVTAVATGDLDGDGRADVVAATTRFEGRQAWAHLDVYRRATSGTWTRVPLDRREGRLRFDAAAVGDVDGDGRHDVAALGPDGETTVYLSERSGRFVREKTRVASPGTCGGAALVVTDLDADGRGDLVAAYAQERSTSADGVCPSEGALMAWRSVSRQAGPRARGGD